MSNKYYLWLLGAGAAFWVSMAQAESSPEPSAEPYLPLFVMYSGSPSAQQLQVLQQFLASNQLSGEVIQDALQTVAHKLKTFKSGFAYPVFRDDTATSGHTCVVADNRHGDLAEAWTLLASERVYRPLLLGRNERLESQQLLDNVFAHELFHCYDLVRHSLEELGQQVVLKGSGYFAYWGEAGADAYAALQHLQHGGDKELLRTVRDFRTVNLLNGDSVHYTATVIDYIIEHHSRQTLRGMNTRQLIALADRIREETALDQDEFAMLEGAASKLNREYEQLLAGHPGLGKAYDGALMRPRGAEISPEYAAAVFTQIRAALWRVGGKKSVNSRYFSPLVDLFALPARPRTTLARLN
jgi:hypothetical protein